MNICIEYMDVYMHVRVVPVNGQDWELYSV